MFNTNNENGENSIVSEVVCVAVYSVVLLGLISMIGSIVYFFG